MVLDDLADGRGLHVADGVGYIAAGIDHEEGPAAYEHEQRNGCLVDFRHALDGYAEVAYAEENDNTD